MDRMYPLYAAIAACVIAQVIKPFINRIFFHEWDWKLVFSTGGMPSSHSALVCALSLATGIIDNFSSTLFGVTVVLAMVVCYDACHVRYYAGKNISVTEQLVKDLKDLSLINVNDPIYETKLKAVLGHTYVEVASGIILGIVISYAYYLIFFN